MTTHTRPGPRALASLCIVCLLLAAAGSAALAAYPPLDDKDVLPPDFRLEKVLTGTVRPSGIAIAPDGTVFYGERTTGNVRVLIGGVQQATAFATLSVATGGSQGLIDVALHPDYAANGYVYVFYTESGTRVNKIRRYQASRSGGNQLGGNALDIFSLGQSPGGTRIGGAMAFGADGKLYVTTGDLETGANGQNNSSMAGKLLRMNDDGTVPADNPIAGSQVYAKGFRDGGGLAANTTVGTLYQTDKGVVAKDVTQQEDQ